MFPIVLWALDNISHGSISKQTSVTMTLYLCSWNIKPCNTKIQNKVVTTFGRKKMFTLYIKVELNNKSVSKQAYLSTLGLHKATGNAQMLKFCKICYIIWVSFFFNSIIYTIWCSNEARVINTTDSCSNRADSLQDWRKLLSWFSSNEYLTARYLVVLIKARVTQRYFGKYCDN